MVERFPDRDRNGRMPGKLDVSPQILGRQRLLQPCELERLEGMRAADRLRYVEALVRVDHDLEGVAHRLAHRREARNVFRYVRLPYFELCAAKPLRFRGERLLDQCLGREMKPASLRR